MCAKWDSGFCEWNGPPEKPPPDGSRTVIGIGVPARQRCFAAIVTRWSHPHEMKSANCISATGRGDHGHAPGRGDAVRMPMIAAPGRMPMIAAPVAPLAETAILGGATGAAIM